MAIDSVQLSSLYDSGYSKHQSLTEITSEKEAQAKAPPASEAETGFGRAAVIELSGHAEEFLARLNGQVRRIEDISLEKLAPQERQRAEKLYGELDEIFGGRHRKELSVEERIRVNELASSINQIRRFSFGAISGDHALRVRVLEQEVDQLLANPDRVLTITEEGRLARLFGQIEELHGTRDIPFIIEEENREQVTAIEKELDSIHEVTPERQPTVEQLQRADDIFGELAALFDTVFKRLSKAA